MMRISKPLIVLAVVSALALQARAQFALGPRAGINLSNISTNQAGVETNSKMGIHGGLTLKYTFHDQLSVQMDALYSQLGAESVLQTSSGNTLTTTTTTSYLDYVQAPLYINFQLPLRSKQLVPYRVKPTFSFLHLYAGGYFGYGLGAQAETTTTVDMGDGTGPQTTVGAKGDVAEGTFNAIDFGALAGLGFSFKLDENDKNRVGLDARYLLGFGNTSNVSGVKETNSAIQGSITYMYKLSNRRYIRH